MFSSSETRSRKDTIMNPEINEKQVMEDSIRKEVAESRSSVKQVKDAFIKDIRIHRSGFHAAKDCIKKDFEEFRSNNLFERSINLFTILNFLHLVLKVGYVCCIFFYNYLRKLNAEVSLGAIDHAYIDQKYITCCLEFWFDEVTSFFNQNQSGKLFIDKLSKNLVNSLDAIQSLSQIPELLKQLEYYKLSMKNHDLISRDIEKTCIKKFKDECVERVIAHCQSSQVESDFLRAFLNFIRASRCIEIITDKLQLELFCCGDLPFDELVEKIMNLETDAHGVEVVDLIETADCLKGEKTSFLVTTFREVIQAYIKPVAIEENNLDGRLVIEVTGKIIVLNKIIHQLQTRLQNNSQIEEVRIVGADILHIDVNIENSIWHGKNIVIVSKKLKIYGEVTWNVSGRDSSHVYSDNAGTGNDGHGKQGTDGHAGESGGNVLIEADEAENSGNLTIISHGGRGSRGQDGGNGSVGKDGKGFTRTEFDERFPSVVRFFSVGANILVRDTVNYILESPKLHTTWSPNEDHFHNATTDLGNNITFSYCAKGFHQCDQSFLLCRGSLGQSGGHGGEYGLGGQGGYNGEIDINNLNIAVNVISGNEDKNGDDGNGGLYGYHGKNGWDMGYVDYQTWVRAVHYGRDQSSKLQLQYYQNWMGSPADSVWCPHRGQYAQINAIPIEHKEEKKYQERRDTRQTNERQHQAQATKKKSISRGGILAKYSHCYSSIENGNAKNLQSNLNTIQQALKAITDNAEQQDEMTAELKVKRQVKFTRPGRNMHPTIIKTAVGSSSDTSRDIARNQGIESLIRHLTVDRLDEPDSHLLELIKSAEQNRTELDRLYSAVATLGQRYLGNQTSPRSVENGRVQHLEQLLIEKYQFAMLRDIAQLLPSNNNVTEDSPAVTPECASRYLIVAKENNNNISHRILGTLNQYLFVNGKEQHEKISKFCKEELEKTDTEPINRSIRKFVSTTAKSNRVHPHVEKSYLEYKEFLEKQVHSLGIFLEPLFAELKRHESIYALWIKRNDDISIGTEFNREIQKHQFLNALYNRFNDRLRQPYNWSNCCGDKDFLEEYNDHTHGRGPVSESYRELLAHIFDVNIRVYSQVQDNQLCILDNHKPSATQTIHILYQEDKFKQLNIDENYLRLENERTEIGRVYTEILEKTNALNKKVEIDDYFEQIYIRFCCPDDQFEYVPKLYPEKSHSTDNEPLKRSVVTFILEVGGSENIHPEVKKYYDDFKEFSEQQKQSLNIFFDAFYSELKRHEHVLALWIAANKNTSGRSRLEEEIKRDRFLNVLYNRFENQLKREYDWNECCEAEGILKAYNDHIREISPCSESNEELGNQFADQGDRLRVKHADPNNLHAHDFVRNKLLKLDEESDYFSEKQNGVLESNFSETEYLVSQAENIVGIMKFFSCPEERLQVKVRLEKITVQYTGHHDILHNILRRFTIDGRHVSFDELCCLVNSILASVIDDRRDLDIIRWIVAAYPQKDWLDELVLLQLERYSKKSLPNKSKWKEYLSKLDNKDILMLFKLKLDQHKSNTPISTDCFEDILYLLSSIPNKLDSLDEVELPDWRYALKEEYWTHKLSQLTNWEESEKLSEASYYLLSIENTFGTSLTKKLIEKLGMKKLSPNTLTNILSSFHTEKWNLSDTELTVLSGCSVRQWVEQMEQKFRVDKKERDVTRLIQLMKGNTNTSKGICDNLPAIENSMLMNNICSQELATNFWFPFRAPEQTKRTADTTTENSSDESPAIDDSIQNIREEVCAINETTAGIMTEADIGIYSRRFRKCLESYEGNITEKKQFIEKARMGLLATVDRAIKCRRGFKLRDTQKLTVLILLMNERNTLAQVSTGEGKSLIVVATSIIKAIGGEKVDIITSSSVLAKRDAKNNADIYSLFGIQASHNCSGNIEQRKAAYSSSQVVYGTLSEFQRDYLLDRFYGKNILGDRNFEHVLVDEVDSMLLDQGNNMLYLSHDIAGLDKLESLYIYIWQQVNRAAKIYEYGSSGFDTEAIKKVVLNELYSLIKREDIQKLDSELDEQQARMIWERLIEAGILDERGKMLKQNIDDNELKIVLSPHLIECQNRLRFLLRECSERNKCVHVPNYLKPFIEEHLEMWIKSAVMAAFMQVGHDYVVDVDKTGSSRELDARITIVDRDTGTDQANSQWDEALHQFLQLKHGCKLSMQSLKAVFISNVSYLKLYKQLNGLTGTLGSRPERDLLLGIHGVDFVTIPTAWPKRFNEDAPILCTDKQEWFQKIFAEASKYTSDKNGKKRSVLIICETIDNAETLNKYFVQLGTAHVHNYTRDHVEFNIAQGEEELEPGHIIIATNLSGRGTDIKITKELRSAGGLHVCLTYLPNNTRIEQQAFGRGARSGAEGSGRLIIIDSKGRKGNNLKLLDLKKQRDFDELHRISYIKSYYETQITAEEYYFDEFQKLYKRLSENLSDNRVCADVKKILLQSCLDKWAFWLDRNNKQVKNVTDEKNQNYCIKALKNFISEFENLKCENNKKWSTWVRDQPVHMIELGKYFCKETEYAVAIELFNEVIQLEPRFSEAAHYYKAFALMRFTDWEKKGSHGKDLQEFKTELREAARLFDERRKFSMYAAGTISNIKEYNKKNVIQVNSYAEQQKNLCNLYHAFSQSIDDVFDQPVSPESFHNGAIKEQQSEFLYEDLLRNGILRKPRVKRNIPEKALKKISLDYGISSEILKSFLSAYKGREIDEKKFRSALKNDVQLPSREDFWRLLIQENILFQNVKYIVIDVEKLKDVDILLLRSLRDKIDKKELEQQTLKSSTSNEIILNTDQTMPQTDCIIFKKCAFKQVIDQQRYEILKSKGSLSFNQKALMDTSKIASTILPRYDSITLQDFSNVNIPTNDAEKILAGLVQQNVLIKVNSESDTYRLIIPSYQIQLIQIPSYPVYQNAVIALLSLCFTYRIALERIGEQLKQENFPIHLRLTSKIHHQLIFDLFDQRIIKFAKLNTEVDYSQKKLNEIYSRRTTQHELERMLSQNGITLFETDRNEFYTHLVKKGWLAVKKEVTCPDTLAPHSGKITDKLHEYLQEIESFLEQDIKYIINDSGKRQKLRFDDDIEERIKQTLDARLQLTNKATIKHIIGVLEQSRSPIKTLKVPDGTLKPLTECAGLSRLMEEVNIFMLNGLDQLLRLEEKKWTRKMLLDTATLIAIGMSQVAIGAAIEVISIGGMTNVAVGLISEGMGDVFFAMNAYRTGHFSWKVYGQYKCRSITLSLVTSGIGALWSKGVQAAGFGSKITGPSLNVGEKVGEMSTSQLINTVGTHSVETVVAKRILRKSMEAITSGIAYTGIDAAVGNYLRLLSDGIGSTFLSVIGKKVEEHKVSASLEMAFRTLGEKKAKQMIDHLTLDSFSEQNIVEKYSHIAFTTARDALRSIGEAVKTMGQYGKNVWTTIGQLISKLLALLPTIEHLVHVANIRLITGNVLDTLDRRITRTLNNNASERNCRQNTPDEIQKELQDCENFKRGIMDQWNSLLRVRVQEIVEQHVIKPILNEGLERLTEYYEKVITEKYQPYQRSDESNGYAEEHERECKEGQQSDYTFDSDSKTEVENSTANEYHDNLNMLIAKTSDHKLLADVVRENVPIDVIHLDACAQVIRKVSGIEGLAIVVKEQDGVRRKFSSSTEGVVQEQIIELELINNRFQLHGGHVSNCNNTKGFSKNNCLFEAISQHVNINMTRTSFRAEIANCIEHDADVQYRIKQDCQSLSTSHRVFCNRREIKISAADRLYINTMDQNVMLSQHTMGKHAYGTKEEPQKHITKLAKKKTHDWQGGTRTVVEITDESSFLRNSRNATVPITGSSNKMVEFMAYDETTEFLSAARTARYETSVPPQKRHSVIGRSDSLDRSFSRRRSLVKSYLSHT